MTTTLKLTDLTGYTGSTSYMTWWIAGLRLTDGVQHLARNGAAWLIDAIASHQPDARRRIGSFQVWWLRVEGGSAVLEAAGDAPPAEVKIRQEIEYTDFPAPGIKLYVDGGVVMLPSEY